MGFYMGFGLYRILFFVAFTLIFCTILVTIFQNIRQWNKNNHAPRVTVPVTVVAKRADVRRRKNMDNDFSHTYTTYYATFQLESGDRMELSVEANAYGLIVEGDKGKLTFQGTRYLNFERL